MNKVPCVTEIASITSVSLYRLAGIFLMVSGICGMCLSGESIVNMPQKWTVFGPYDNGMELSKENSLPNLTYIPEFISIGNCTRRGIVVMPQHNTVDFADLFGNVANRGSSAPGVYLMGVIDCQEEQTLTIGCGADWWMRWYLDGKPVFDTFPAGNGQWNYDCSNHVFRCTLIPGKHILSVLVISGSQGWKLAFDQGEKYIELNRLAREKAVEEEKWRTRLIQEKARINSHMKLVIYGSSVASGAGASRGEGWADHLAKKLRARNWTVNNCSVGGDNTEKLLARFSSDLLSEHPDVVILALSLANEGLLGEKPEEIYLQYIRNMRKLIQLCQKNHIIPVVSGCYPNNNYKELHYNYIRKFNEELGSWPVTSFNFMSAVDDGSGKWKHGTDKDAGHPNNTGHEEMYSAISPGIFDSLIGIGTWEHPPLVLRS